MPSLNPDEQRDLPADRKLGVRAAFRISRFGRRLAAAAARARRLPVPNFNAAALALLAATGVYGVTLGGHGVAVVDAVSQPLGFSINTVDVSGNHETTEIDALQALWSTGSQSLPSLDVDAARAKLEEMPWIAHASVTKTYPDRVSIRLEEKRPFAVWQKDRELFLIDRDGREIMPYLVGRFQDLPFVVGPGANLRAAELIDNLKEIPEFRARVRAYVRVGDRRWDLRMEDGVTVRLPEDGGPEAAARIARMDRDMGLLSRDIAAVDLRFADRIAIRLTPEALARRQAMLKDREKQLKQMRKENRA